MLVEKNKKEKSNGQREQRFPKPTILQKERDILARGTGSNGSDSRLSNFGDWWNASAVPLSFSARRSEPRLLITPSVC